MAKIDDNEARSALKLSLNEACHQAMKLLGDPPPDVREPLLDTIRISLDDEMAVRLDGLDDPDDEFPAPPLQFSQFRSFYTIDDFFRDDLFEDVSDDDLTEDASDDNDSPDDDSEDESLDWKAKLTERMAAFALLRAAEGSAQVRSAKSKTPDGLLAVACAAVDAWQAIALARVRERGGADDHENRYDRRRRKEAISKAGLASRLTAKGMLEEKVGHLTDEYRKQHPKATNLTVAVDIHPQVEAYAKEIGYTFQVKPKIGEPDKTLYAGRIERMIGKVRPKHRKG
jgi:hypothetical protein